MAGLGLFVLLLSLCVPTVAFEVHKNHPLFILDEFSYADYLQKVDDGQPFVRKGEITGQKTLRELACRGFTPDSLWPVRPPCDAPSYDASAFPNGGVDSADVHPPTYFIVTDIGARAIMAVGITHNLIQAGRLFGAVWMAAGLLAIWYLARAFGANRWAAGLGLALVAANPGLRWEWYYLTPDASNILIGALVVLAALHWERSGRGGLPLLVGAGALAMAFKFPNLIVVVAMAAYMAVRAVLARRASPADRAVSGFLEPRRYVLAAIGLLGGAGVAAVGWLAVRLALAVSRGPSPMDQHYGVSGLGIRQLTENVGRFISVWDVSAAKSYPFALITSYVLVGSLLAAVVRFDHHDRRHTLASVGGVMVVIGPLLLVVSTVLAAGAYFVVEARYGATLVPLEIALAACLWRSRASLIAVGTLVVTYNAAVFLLVLRQ
ncbi:MAG: glycosyltransferase family 39 protein [Actinomycetota bacterium]|nr:glycosyltransferase family 39 protein [Actinomycetota bacterium]